MENVQGVLPIEFEEKRIGTQRVGASDTLKGVRVRGPGRGSASTQDLFTPPTAALLERGSITGTVADIRHANPQTGFHILRVRLSDGGMLVTFAGQCEPVSIGDSVEASGTWERHARYGNQLRARFIRVIVPSTGAEIYAFLKSGGIKEVGAKSAEKLLDYFGDRLAEVMTSPTTLMAAGITEKRARAIAEAWSNRSRHTEMLAYLQALKIGPLTSERIFRHYGEKTKQMILADPYRVAREISGLGFKTADQMAMALDINRRDPRRIDAAVLHVMNQIGRDGHCACSRQRIMSDVRSLLSVEDKIIREGIDRLVDRQLLVEEANGGSPVIYEAGVLKCETEIARRITERIAPEPLPGDIDAMILSAANAVGIPSIHENQALAIKTSLGARLSVVTGGPGSGKTSSIKVLLQVYSDLNPKAVISLCAPTGRAAQRMAESTGREAKTIHRMLEWSPEAGGFQRKEENPLDADLLVIDETSMLDIWLTRDLLRALRPEATVVFVGDVDQLPSVGAGYVLGDLIESGVVPVTRLTRIFRQGFGSQIAEAARQINNGVMPRIGSANRKSDIWAAWDVEPEASLPRISRMVAEIAPSLGYDPMRDVQVLTAGHQGLLGTISLNQTLQEALNPARPGAVEAKIGEVTFREGDRVIQTANDYDLDVFNGDIGQILSIESGIRKKDRVSLRVSFDGREVVYSAGDAKNLLLAYAISVHKSQGSEFPVVIFVPTTQHFTMLRKTLIYTAITRAKKLCVLIGQQKAAQIAVRKADKGRITGLARRIAIENAEVERMTGGAY